MKKIAPVKVPKASPKSRSRQVTVKSYSPGWIVLLRVSAACLRETPSGLSNGPVVEKVLFCVVVMVVPGGKVGVVAPTGPVTSIEEELPLFGAVQPPEVRAVMICVSLPLVGAKVRVPRVPAGGAALATPPRSSEPPPATATTRGAATNRLKNLFLSMSEYSSR